MADWRVACQLKLTPGHVSRPQTSIRTNEGIDWETMNKFPPNRFISYEVKISISLISVPLICMPPPFFPHSLSQKSPIQFIMIVCPTCYRFVCLFAFYLTICTSVSHQTFFLYLNSKIYCERNPSSHQSRNMTSQHDFCRLLGVIAVKFNHCASSFPDIRRDGIYDNPDSKVHVANMGPIWSRQVLDYQNMPLKICSEH